MWLRLTLLAVVSVWIVSLYTRLHSLEVELLQTINNHQTELTQRYLNYSKSLAEAVRQQERKQGTIDSLDRKLKEKDEFIKHEVEKLTASVSDGTTRLLVNVKPTNTSESSPCMSCSTSSTELVDGQTFELAEESRSAYYSLTSGIKSTELQVEGLQEYILDVCLKK